MGPLLRRSIGAIVPSGVSPAIRAWREVLLVSMGLHLAEREVVDPDSEDLHLQASVLGLSMGVRGLMASSV